jgi:hypothetical protein
MTIRGRIQCLERALPKPDPVTDEERLRRLRELLPYQGTDPAVLSRRDRALQLLERVRERLAAQGIEWPQLSGDAPAERRTCGPRRHRRSRRNDRG